MEHFIGADIGGTSSKIALFDEHGRILDQIEGNGGNFRTAPGEAFHNIADALTTLLNRNSAAEIVSGHFGVAGAGAARYSDINSACQALWSNSGISAPLSVSSDLEIAYAAASTNDGLLLLAGTGAVGCAFHNGQLIGRSDGMGWILGDVGAGLWLGKRGLEAVARDLDRRGPSTKLTALVLEHFGIAAHTGDPRQELIAHVYAQSPTEYGKVAPFVSAAFIDGDKVAGQILSQGATSLVETLTAALHEGHDTSARNGADFAPLDLVLAGTLLTTDTPTRALVLELIASSPILNALHRAEPRAPIYGSYQFARTNIA